MEDQGITTTEQDIDTIVTSLGRDRLRILKLHNDGDDDLNRHGILPTEGSGCEQYIVGENFLLFFFFHSFGLPLFF